MEADEESTSSAAHIHGSPETSPDYQGGAEHTHTKPITPSDIFDTEHPDRETEQDRSSNTADSQTSATSQDLMPPPPRPGRQASHTHGHHPDSRETSHESKPFQRHEGPGALGEPEPATSPTGAPDSPEDPLESFDWDELEQRYHDMVTDKNREFEQVWDDYCQLQDFFSIWCEMVGKRETDRTFKRHKTQQYYVRREEDDYEQDRVHYVGILDAFKSALALLSGPAARPGTRQERHDS